MRRIAPLGVLVALFVPLNGAVAQMSAGARSVGMGGGGMVFATGVDAVELNPANLGWAGGWNLSVYELGVSTIGTGARFGELLKVFGAEVDDVPLVGTALSSDLTVDQIINNIPAGGIQLSAVSDGFFTTFATEQADNVPSPGAALPSIGLTLGPIGVRARSRVMADMTISKEIVDLLGNGFVLENIQDYRVGDTGWRTTSFSDVTVSYGTTLGGLLSIGVGGRYVMGHSMVDGAFFEPRVEIVDGTLELDAVAVEATSGTGYGLDVGLSLELPLGFRASASGTNVVQRMTWDDALVSHSATFGSDANGVDQFEEDFIDLLDEFEEQAIDPSAVSIQVYDLLPNFFEESYFPQVFRAGVGWQSGGTSLEATGVKVSPRGRFTSAWDERLSLGIEQKIPILTLRAGMARGQDGLGALTAGAGLGIGPFKLDLSGGKFNGESEVSTWDGYYGTISVQLKGGGA